MQGQPPIRRIEDFRGTTLKWFLTKAFHRHYELRSERDLYATLSWPKRLSRIAEAQTAQGKFTIETHGVLHRYVAVKKQSADMEYVHMQLDRGYNGALQFIDGRTYNLNRISYFWRFHWTMTDANKALLCTFRGTRRGLEVIIEPIARHSPHLTLMTILGWYVICLLQEEMKTAVHAAILRP